MGTAGALSVTVPVAWLMPLIGWRTLFLGVAGALLLASWVVFSRLRPVEQAMSGEATGRAAQSISSANAAGSAAASYRAIFSDPYFRRMALLGAIHQGGFMALQSLWAGPWMITVLGMSVEQTSQVLFLFNLTLLIAYLGLSWWAPRYVAFGQHRGWPALRVVAVGLSLAVTLQALFVLFPYPASWSLWLLFAVVITVTTLGHTHVSLAFPASLVGRANSAFNLTLFIGAFLVQWGIGVLVDGFEALGWPGATAMRLAMACYLMLQALTLWRFIRQWSITSPSIHLNKD